ncbi:MAG: Fe-Mn family superoxide dismutase, partial [Comamonadaceae bacterium]|nr:Fe-Mn family superoxide dismutase [Comamonadaceae bacterium]
MPNAIKTLAYDPATLSGLSEQLILSHWENNYSGAVKRLNAIEAQLATLDWSNAPVFIVNGLKREEMIASGSMILHEVYFDSLGGGGGDPSGTLRVAIERDFGSLQAWRTEFKVLSIPFVVVCLTLNHAAN